MPLNILTAKQMTILFVICNLRQKPRGGMYNFNIAFLNYEPSQSVTHVALCKDEAGIEPTQKASKNQQSHFSSQKKLSPNI